MSVSSTRRETFVSNSSCRRSRRLRDVTYAAFAAGKRGSVHRKEHGDGRLINRDPGSGAGFSAPGDGFTYRDSFNARDCNNVSEFSFGDIRTFQARERKKFGDLVVCSEPSSLAMPTSSPVRIVPLKTRAMAKRPREPRQSRFATRICSRPAGSPFGGGMVFTIALKQRRQVFAATLYVGRSRAQPWRR